MTSGLGITVPQSVGEQLNQQPTETVSSFSSLNAQAHAPSSRKPQALATAPGAHDAARASRRVQHVRREELYVRHLSGPSPPLQRLQTQVCMCVFVLSHT